MRDWFSDADPANATYYAANFDGLQGAPGRPRRAHPRGGRDGPARGNRKLLTYHDSWAYWAREYGFTVIGAVQASDFSDPSPQEVAELIDQIRAEQVPAVFGSEVFPSPVLEQIASEIGATFVDELRDDEPPGDPSAPEHTYLGMLKKDMQVMMDALGGQGTAIFADYAGGRHLAAVTESRLRDAGRRGGRGRAARPVRGRQRQLRRAGGAPGHRPASCPRGGLVGHRRARAAPARRRSCGRWSARCPELRGRVLVDGRDVAAGQPANVGWVPQLETVDWDFPATVREVVLMGRWARRPWRPWMTAADRAEADRGPGAPGHRWPGRRGRSGSCPVASSSASSWRVRSSPTRCCCCSTSPPAAWTSGPATRCCTCWRTSTPRA